MLIVTGFVLFFALREIYLELWLKRSMCIKISQRGWVTHEIWRRVSMERVPGHVSEYPLPREGRILVNRLLGMVISYREVSVALPSSACEHLENIHALDFNGKFPTWLQVADS
jgi:hypothetical protein